MRNLRAFVVLTIGVLLFGASPGIAQLSASQPASPVDSIFTSEQLRDDLAVLHLALKQAHPGTYRYTAQSELDGAFGKTSSAFAKPATEAEFLQKLLPVLALVRDDHTYALPSNAF